MIRYYTSPTKWELHLWAEAHHLGGLPSLSGLSPETLVRWPSSPLHPRGVFGSSHWEEMMP